MGIGKEILDTIQKEIDTAKYEIMKLRQELSIKDKTISDVLHQLEFCESLSASQGYKHAIHLKNLREDRRHIKDELEELQVLVSKLNEFHIHKVKKSLIDLETHQKERIYTPRILTPEKREIMLKII